MVCLLCICMCKQSKAKHWSWSIVPVVHLLDLLAWPGSKHQALLPNGCLSEHKKGRQSIRVSSPYLELVQYDVKL